MRIEFAVCPRKVYENDHWGSLTTQYVHRGGDDAFEVAEGRIRERSSSWRRRGKYVTGAMCGGVPKDGWGIRERLMFDVLGMQ